VQKNTAVKEKGPNPKYSLQQQSSEPSHSSSLQHKLNHHTKKKQNAHKAVPSSDFILAHPTIIITSAHPAPTIHSIASIGPTGVTI